MEILLMIIVGIIGFALDGATEHKIPPTELEQLRKDLLKYCEQDTWAMVKLVYVLRDSVQ